MKKIHVTRNSPNWIELENNYEDHEISDKIKQNMKKIFKNWNANIKPSYFKFRDLIVKIAKENHSRLNADLYFDTALNIQDKLNAIDDRFVVLFSDDDDWYHPNVFDAVIDSYEQDESLDAIMWNHCAYCNNYKQFEKNHRTRPYFILTNNLFFHTNNYALTDNFFKKFSSQEDIDLLNTGKDYDVYYGHTVIDLLFKQRMKFIKLQNCMSVANKSISSYSYWWENDATGLPEVIQNCASGNSDPIPTEVQWATKEILEGMEIYKTLKCVKVMF